MASLREVFGLDPEEITWQDFALCKNDETNQHYDDYESDVTVARIVDDKCLSCPVMKQCLESGLDNREWGCWGGVFLVSGKVDISRNAHKSEETWQAIRERINA